MQIADLKRKENIIVLTAARKKVNLEIEESKNLASDAEAVLISIGGERIRLTSGLGETACLFCPIRLNLMRI